MSKHVIGGRHVYLVNGQSTQTVNVCDANNRRGQYDWVVRFTSRLVRPDDLDSRATQGPEDLVRWLVVDRQGGLECRPPAESSPPWIDAGDGVAAAAPPVAPPIDWRGYYPDRDPWLRQARELVDAAIDELVLEFLKDPYLHRVEHSLHCRLFHLLAGREPFTAHVPIGGGRHRTQTLHKEWPETVAEPLHRRGNFDLAVLPPDLLSRFGVGEFREGRVPAPLVIEIGLDYDWPHLAGDREKLLRSSVPFAYLLHLERECDERPRVRDLIESTSAGPRSAYARTRGTQHWHKLLGGGRIVPHCPDNA